MLEHQVAFNIGTGTVVCTCGEYFASNVFTDSAVAQWAAHLRHVSGTSLRAAYETGWSDACADWLQQGRDPSWPIGRRKRSNYPAPSEWVEPHRTHEEAERCEVD